MCTVLDEMRQCCKRLNFSLMDSLIEEAQILANRMEGALEDQKDIRTLSEEITKLKKLRKELYEECKDMLEKQDGEKRPAESDTEDQIACD
jgi:predicted transcriptional regulator